MWRLATYRCKRPLEQSTCWPGRSFRSLAKGINAQFPSGGQDCKATTGLTSASWCMGRAPTLLGVGLHGRVTEIGSASHPVATIVRVVVATISAHLHAAGGNAQEPSIPSRLWHSLL